MKETFFLQVTPGLEDIARLELEMKFQSLFPLEKVPVCHMERGGFSIELEILSGLSLNYWLKIPNRILMRFAHFKCRDLPKLYNKIKKMNWSPYFGGQEFNIKVSAHNSRLFDDRKIIKTIKDALEEYKKRQIPGKKAKETVLKYKSWSLMCRFEEDWCTLSIDTSGERLGLRGIKTHIGLAPLRENLAASLFLFSFRVSNQGSDQYNSASPLFLFDPFAGSGTIIQESLLFFEPSISREFAFEFFPKFSKNPKALCRPSPLNLDIHFSSFANDKNPNQLSGLKANYVAATMDTQKNKWALGDSMDKNHLDKNLLPLLKESKAKDSWIITNPPFGKRLKSPGALKDLLKHFFSIHQWQQVGILLPKQVELPTKEFNCIGKLEFSHGGEDVIYSLWNQEI